MLLASICQKSTAIVMLWRKNGSMLFTQIWNHHGPFNWDGHFYHLKNVYGYPRPFDGPPPIMNAAGSGEGRSFAARNADFLFAISVDLEKSKSEVADIKEKARSINPRHRCFHSLPRSVPAHAKSS